MSKDKSSNSNSSNGHKKSKSSITHKRSYSNGKPSSSSASLLSPTTTPLGESSRQQAQLVGLSSKSFTVNGTATSSIFTRDDIDLNNNNHSKSSNISQNNSTTIHTKNDMPQVHAQQPTRRTITRKTITDSISHSSSLTTISNNFNNNNELHNNNSSSDSPLEQGGGIIISVSASNTSDASSSSRSISNRSSSDASQKRNSMASCSSLSLVSSSTTAAAAASATSATLTLSSANGDGNKASASDTPRLRHGQTKLRASTHSNASAGSNGSSSSSKSNDRFHQLFPSVSMDENVLNSYSCGYMKSKNFHHGVMFLTANYICFYSKVLNHEHILIIRLEHVRAVVKTMHALIFPTAIRIDTNNSSYSFGSFRSRSQTYERLHALWHAIKALNQQQQQQQQLEQQQLQQQQQQQQQQENEQLQEQPRQQNSDATFVGDLEENVKRRNGDNIDNNDDDDDDDETSNFTESETNTQVRRNESFTSVSSVGLTMRPPRAAGSTAAATATATDRVTFVDVSCPHLSATSDCPPDPNCYNCLKRPTNHFIYDFDFDWSKRVVKVSLRPKMSLLQKVKLLISFLIPGFFEISKMDALLPICFIMCALLLLNAFVLLNKVNQVDDLFSELLARQETL